MTTTRDTQFDGTGLSGAHIGDDVLRDVIGQKTEDVELLWVFISPTEFTEVSGTWALSESSDVALLTRTAATGADAVRAKVPVPATLESVEYQVAKAMAVYSVDTADVDDVLLEVVATTSNGHGAIPTAVVLAGDADADYDADHANAAARGLDTGAPEEHTLEVTVPVGDRVASSETVSLDVRFTVDGDAGPSGVVLLYGAWVGFTKLVK